MYVSPPPPGCGKTWRTPRACATQRLRSPIRRENRLERVAEGKPPRVALEPGKRRVPKLRTGLIDAHDSVGEVVRRRRRRDEAVLALHDELGGRIVLSADDDGGRSAGQRLEH